MICEKDSPNKKAETLNSTRFCGTAKSLAITGKLGRYRSIEAGPTIAKAAIIYSQKGMLNLVFSVDIPIPTV